MIWGIEKNTVTYYLPLVFTLAEIPEINFKAVS